MRSYDVSSQTREALYREADVKGLTYAHYDRHLRALNYRVLSLGQGVSNISQRNKSLASNLPLDSSLRRYLPKLHWQLQRAA